ncbi:hypothetical protein PGT21_028693 [Puccinia graminis f. sp. tritici]|uniref:Uncharacterized protein n=1 Tax=Puccinia graminis f. sp. tritici TaxID=56615 RepID=A0A5B0MMH7_PUCGR|nr:hypothetical protein PGT21_028693 [Puccinia graminis f. sp. tritici]
MRKLYRIDQKVEIVCQYPALELFTTQGVHNIVTWKLACLETDYKDEDTKAITKCSQRVYYTEEPASDWDTLSEVARATLKMTLSVDLAMRYKETKPVSTLFKTICDAYEKNTHSDLKSAKLTPADQQVCDRLLCGLDNTWKPICDHLVYSPSEISLDDTIAALEAHEVSKQVLFNDVPESYAVW